MGGEGAEGASGGVGISVNGVGTVGAEGIDGTSMVGSEGVDGTEGVVAEGVGVEGDGPVGLPSPLNFKSNCVRVRNVQEINRILEGRMYVLWNIRKTVAVITASTAVAAASRA